MSRNKPDHEFACSHFPLIPILIKNPKLLINHQLPLNLIINLCSRCESTFSLKLILNWPFGDSN